MAGLTRREWARPMMTIILAASMMPVLASAKTSGGSRILTLTTIRDSLAS